MESHGVCHRVKRQSDQLEPAQKLTRPRVNSDNRRSFNNESTDMNLFHEIRLNARTRVATVEITKQDKVLAKIECELLSDTRKMTHTFDSSLSEEEKKKLTDRFTFVAVLDDVIQHSGGQALTHTEKGQNVKDHFIFSSDFGLDD